MSGELLPCPFCGGANLRAKTYDIDGYIAHIECTDCDDMLGPMSEFKYEDTDEAIADASRVWNRRAEPAELTRLRSENAELVEALVSLVDEFGCTIEQYDKIGSDFTHKDGTEVFHVSAVLDRRELVDAARALLSRVSGGGK